jgi:hypothetical protein
MKRRDLLSHLMAHGCTLLREGGKLVHLASGVRQLNPVFRDFRTDFPVFTRVPAAVFKSTCGGTSCKYGAFIDMT